MGETKRGRGRPEWLVCAATQMELETFWREGEAPSLERPGLLIWDEGFACAVTGIGIPFTFATLWAVLCLAFGYTDLALVLIALRMIAATTAGWIVLRSKDVLRLWLLIPFRDLFGVAVWLTGLFGSTVLWRGQRLTIHRDGRIR